jgi:uncharacterized protein involved in outer membrane biogenesis
MRRFLRWLCRIVLALVILAVIVAVAGILLADTIAREILISRLRSETGMEAKIRAVHVGLLSPTVSIEGIKLYNTAEFGGSVCLDLPELHIEYDAAALRSRQLHLTLLRLDLAELSVVLDKQGRMNFDTLREKSQKSSPQKKQAGSFKFTGIDTLNITRLGKFRRSDLASGREEVIDFGLKNQILRHVKTAADLAPLGLAAVLHGKVSASGGADLDLGALLKNLVAP